MDLTTGNMSVYIKLDERVSHKYDILSLIGLYYSSGILDGQTYGIIRYGTFKKMLHIVYKYFHLSQSYQ